MIRVIDYGVGNIQAFLNIYKRLGIDADRATCAAELSDATHLVLPGVGSFDHAMGKLHASGMLPVVQDMVLVRKLPIVGICVGMQMLANGSDEGGLPGLGWIPGRVRSMSRNTASARLPMPHMGWNTLRTVRQGGLLEGLDGDPRFYFLHSYYFECEDPAHVSATASYGADFASVVSAGNIHGIQCHPEKSHAAGGRFLKNFAES